MGAARYDTIGRGYRLLRRADPRIAQQIEEALDDALDILNVGAGSGSYEPINRHVVAAEPSSVMIAQRKATAAPVVRTNAERLPFAASSFDAAMAILTVHHWDDPPQGLRELARVADRVVVLTFEPSIHFDYWLYEEYLPEARALRSAHPPRVEAVAELIHADRTLVVPIPSDCRDGFTWAWWRRPRAYLNRNVQACNSSMAELPEELVASRMRQLSSDLDSGLWYRRHADLLNRESIDGGFRLIIRN